MGVMSFDKMKSEVTKMNKKKIEGILSLFAAAVIWGTAFVAQTEASDSLGAFDFLQKK